MATPLDFFQGHVSRPVNCYRLIPRHVANMWACEQVMWAQPDVSSSLLWAFFGLLSIQLSRRRFNYFVLSALDFGRFKRSNGSIYRNLRESSIFILYVNGHDFEDLCFGMLTVGTPYFDCICWLVSVVTDSRVFIQSNIVWSQWKSNLKARSITVSQNHGTANYVNTVHFYSSRKILESVARSLFSINEHAIANVCFIYLCFQFRIMYVKIILLQISSYAYNAG